MTAIINGIDLLSLKTGGAITTKDQLAQIITGLTTGSVALEPELKFCHKEARVAGAAASVGVIGMPQSLFQMDGCPMSGGATPTGWANPTNTTAGGIMQANAGGGRTKWILDVIAASPNGGMLVGYDRLGHMGGLSGTVTSAQNVNGGSPGTTTRYTNGLGNQIWLEIYSAIGTATTVTVNYTNDQGVAGQVTQPVVWGGVGRQEAQRITQCSLAAGDQGVQAVTSVTVLATTSTAGNFGVTIAHPLFAIPITIIDGSGISDFLNGPMPALVANACVSLVWHPSTATATVIDFSMRSVEV